MKLKFSVCIPILLLLIFFWHQSASAHKVIVFAWVENGMIHTESSFGGKKKAKNGKIKVFDESQQLILEGRTDEHGLFSFPIPENINSGLIIRLDASTGHQAEWRLEKKELVQPAALDDIKRAMETKEKLEKNPSMGKILGGIAIIIGVAFIARLFLKNKKQYN